MFSMCDFCSASTAELLTWILDENELVSASSLQPNCPDVPLNLPLTHKVTMKEGQGQMLPRENIQPTRVGMPPLFHFCPSFKKEKVGWS